MSTAIELVDVGPIKKLSIIGPKEGAIIVLSATNDAGKSEALDAIETAVTGRGKVDVRRGAVRGEVNAFGVSIKIAGKTKRTGELEVQSLEGRFSIEDLIDPKIKDPLAADSKRIKTLIQVKGTKPSIELFHHLLGTREAFDEIVGRSAIDADDIVVMADRIKRDIESAARKEEDHGETADSRARGAREAASGVNLEQEFDSDRLSSSLELAIRYETELTSQRDAAERANAQRDQAIDDLKKAEEQYHGPTVDDARRDETTAHELLASVDDVVREIEKQLSEAKHRAQLARNDSEASQRARLNAERHELMVSKWREQVTAKVGAAPHEREIAAASQAVQFARQAVEQGALVRRAMQHLEAADKFSSEASEHSKRAIRLRDAAKGTDEVLSTLVAQSGTPLRVEAGRLMVDQGEPKFFAELSHGTRSRMALDIAIDSVGPGGVIVLKQEFWEGIAPARKRELAAHVRGKKVLVLTAQATDDKEIVTEEYR